MKKIFLFLLIFYNLSFSQTYSGSGGIITDNQQVVEFSINVNGLPQNSLNSTFGVTQVCLNISHTWNSDLNVWLVSPDGTLSNLFSGIGGDSDNFTNTCFSQSATTSIVSGVAPYNGTYKPQETIGNVNNNQNGNGIWKLRILDTYPQDEGNLISWNITFGPNAPTPFVFTSSNLPIVIINTTEQIVDEPSIIGTIRLLIMAWVT
jgi:subtilisin-like proprotein convertase family protein